MKLVSIKNICHSLCSNICKFAAFNQHKRFESAILRELQIAYKSFDAPGKIALIRTCGNNETSATFRPDITSQGREVLSSNLEDLSCRRRKLYRKTKLSNSKP